MALIRALNTAVSGLKAQQFRIELVGHNIANVDTTAYKTSRAEFNTLLSQLLRAGVAPQGNLGGIDPGVVIVDQVHVLPAWRGLRLGLIGTGLTLRELGRGSSVAVLFPMEPGTQGEEQRSASRERLTKYWGRLGFEPWTDEVMALSLIHTTFEEHLDRLCRPRKRR